MSSLSVPLIHTHHFMRLPAFILIALWMTACEGPLHRTPQESLHRQKGTPVTVAAKTCKFCGKPLEDKWVVYEGNRYHRSCFEDHVQLRCGICGKKISGTYTTDSEGAYHVACFRERKLPRCCVCSLPMEGEIIVDPWGNKAHATHGNLPTDVCSACNRILSPKTSKGAFAYADRRKVCGICRESAVDRSSDGVERFRKTVLHRLADVGLADLSREVPIQLVDLQTLIRKSELRHGDNLKGFTLCRTQQWGAGRHKQQTIYILYGLPSLVFEGVLAHEYLHVWIHEHDKKLPADTTEGFCNLGTMQVYEQDGSEFAKVLLKNMEKNPDPAYGRAYVKLKKRLKEVGWKRLIGEL